MEAEMLRGATVLIAIAIAVASVLGDEAAARARRHDWRPPEYVYRVSAYPRYRYRLNPYAEPRWFAPGFSFGFGDWGFTPSYYPYAQMWSRAGRPDDLACNMPSSPCWNQDRE
jgi:hypothetical protein